jgi:glycine/D-amino acid oxidase-like deaminating enzyme
VQNRPDAIVIGLGVMGAAITYELARRGATVLGVDRHTPPHELGSTHGRSRIIREAYYEHPLYVPLVQRARELWTELEELTGALLFRPTGGLMVGPQDGTLVRGALDSARTHDLDHQLLDAGSIRRRFPGLLPETDHVGVYEPRAGMLHAEGCVRALLSLARGHGAELRPRTRVLAWHVEPASGDVLLQTSGGPLHTPLAIFAVGPWLNALLASERGQDAGDRGGPGGRTASTGGGASGHGDRGGPGDRSASTTDASGHGERSASTGGGRGGPGERSASTSGGASGHGAAPLALPLTVERQVSHWFAPAPGVHAFRAAECPLALWEYAPDRILYTFPDTGQGVKAGIHHEGDIVDPDAVDRTVSLAEEARVRALLERCMPGAAHTGLHASVCLYTNTPDHHFVIDTHPAHEQVLLVSACSGHGFKFATALGEAVAEWVLEGGSRFDLGVFGVQRLSAGH